MDRRTIEGGWRRAKEFEIGIGWLSGGLESGENGAYEYRDADVHVRELRLCPIVWPIQ